MYVVWRVYWCYYRPGGNQAQAMFKLWMDIRNNRNNPEVRAALEAFQRTNPQAHNLTASLLNTSSPTIEHGISVNSLTCPAIGHVYMTSHISSG